MLKHADAPVFYDFVGGFLHAAFPNDKSPAREEIDNIILGTRLTETAFESEGLDWVMAHWRGSEIDTIVNVAVRLRRFDMINPIVMAAEQFRDPPHETLIGGYYESAEYLTFAARLTEIQAEFDILGGALRFQQAANKMLHKRLDVLQV